MEIQTFAEIRERYRAVYAASRELEETVAKLCPPGSRILHTKFARSQEAEVIMTSGDRLKIRNPRTDKTYWIHAFYVAEIRSTP